MVLAEWVDLNAGRVEHLDDARRVLRVRCQTTNVLDNDNVEATGAGICHEPSEPGSAKRRSRPSILVLADKRRARPPSYRRGEAAVAAGKLGPITTRDDVGVGGDPHRRGCAHFAPFVRVPREAAARFVPFVARARPLPVAVLGALSPGAPSAKR